MNKNKNQTKNSPAFTIVELLIVIVIIGILAAITIISYTGITKKANESTVQAELSNAKKQISLYYAEHGVYPKTLGLNNCLSNDTVTPDPDTKYCLKSSGGSTFTLTDATGFDYTLTLTKGTDIAYKVTKDTGPTSTTAVVTTFAKAWGGSGNDYGMAIVKTSDGGYAATGYTTSYGVSGNEIFITKYDSFGILLWNKTWGSTGDDVPESIVQSSDGGFVITGYTHAFGAGGSEHILLKFDSNGNLIWNKTWGGVSAEYGNSLIQTNDGGYVVTGMTMSYGAGGSDVLLLKFDANGNLLWSKTWGGAGNEGGIDVVQNGDNSYTVTGYCDDYGAGNNDVILIKFDSTGNLIWNKTWGGAGSEAGRGLTKSNDGGFVITGSSNSYGATNNVIMIKFDSTGNLIWNKTWGGAGNNVGYGISYSSDNNFFVIGSTDNYGAGSGDVLLLKYDSDGNIVWNKTWGSASSDTGMGIVKTIISDSISVIGHSSGYGVGLSDLLLLKFSNVGTINGCSSPMCQTPTATVTTPSATITTPSASVSSPSATITSPTATVTTPTATVTTVVAP